MKNKVSFIITLFFTFVCFSQTPCDSGMAGVYPCDGFDLLSEFTVEDLDSTRGNDSWGWTDPDDGKEYAIIGLNNGTAFIDISDPINPIYLGKVPTHTGNSTWRDVKVYSNHAFIVSEASNHGMQVFDLTRLRSVANPPETFSEDAHYNGFGSSHNIAINEDTGYAYSVGDNTFSGGAHFVDISDPVNPIAAGGFAAGGYTHDAHVVIYEGPDTDYTGREIYVGSNETDVVIVDVTDKNNPQQISSISYSNVAYTHQGWLTEDHRYFLLGDEADEIDFGFNTRTIIFNLEDLDNPSFHFEYSGTTFATDHNGYVKGNKFYISNNSAGLRVLNIEDIANQNIFEESYFDSYPPHNDAGYIGVWNVYPFFESGVIVMSDRENILFVRDPLLSNDDLQNLEFALYPNPVTNRLTIEAKLEAITTISINDISGKLLFSEKNMNIFSKTINLSDYSTGMYFITINNQLTKKVLKK
ncbi:MAG: choice-of-anchor B domain-containing protein [Flavobacteriaceae bacterium]|jgi:choice-of-anchor B domain-containing protein|uniref:choice-of-anchor B family protein n=1 Tax=Candidatus Marifrigoribacter sp. Uisw_064 TaxID=3230970 RepID=UPI003ADB39DC